MEWIARVIYLSIGGCCWRGQSSSGWRTARRSTSPSSSTHSSFARYGVFFRGDGGEDVLIRCLPWSSRRPQRHTGCVPAPFEPPRRGMAVKRRGGKGGGGRRAERNWSGFCATHDRRRAWLTAPWCVNVVCMLCVDGILFSCMYIYTYKHISACPSYTFERQLPVPPP